MAGSMAAFKWQPTVSEVKSRPGAAWLLGKNCTLLFSFSLLSVRFVYYKTVQKPMRLKSKALPALGSVLLLKIRGPRPFWSPAIIWLATCPCLLWLDIGLLFTKVSSCHKSSLNPYSPPCPLSVSTTLISSVGCYPVWQHPQLDATSLRQDLHRSASRYSRLNPKFRRVDTA